MVDSWNANSAGGAQGMQGQPPAPPGGPAGYGYGHAPPPRRGGLFTGLLRPGLLIALLLFTFIIGFYTALIVINTQPGPAVSVYEDGDPTERIAIIPAVGLIDDGLAEFVRQAVKDAIEDDSIKAVVVRVDSPGGAVTASDEISHHFKRLKEKRGVPIIASYGDMAASGGYYVSAMADHIIVQPTTITGSIGVIAQAITMQELMEEKLGIKAEVITSTRSTEKDVANNMFRQWTDRDRDVLRNMMDKMHDQFVDVVAEGRKSVLDRQQVVSLATGKVFTGQEAIDAKLADEMGYIEAALAEARKRGGFKASQPQVVIYEQRGDVLDLIGLNWRGGGTVAGARSGGAATVSLPAIDPATVRRWIHELGVPQFMYMFH